MDLPPGWGVHTRSPRGHLILATTRVSVHCGGGQPFLGGPEGPGLVSADPGVQEGTEALGYGTPRVGAVHLGP